MEEEVIEEKPNSNWSKKIKRFFLKLFLLILLALIGGVAFVYFYTYSEGWRSGTLTKFSRKGYVVKTWEGEIFQRGSEDGSLNVMNVKWLFSVEDKRKNVVETLNSYNGARFRIHYNERLNTFFWLGDTHYFVDSVVLVSDD